MVDKTESNKNELIDLMPGFYKDTLVDDEHSAATDLIRLLQKSITQLNSASQINHKPVLRFIKTGKSGFERYHQAAWLNEHNASLLSQEQRALINDVRERAPMNWQGAIRILEIIFPAKTIALVEGKNVRRFLPTQNMTGLQGENSLGQNTVLGHKLEDKMNRCKFSVSALSNDELSKYGDDPFVIMVGYILKAFIGQPLEIELVYTLAADTEKNIALGAAKQAVLGAKTWLSAAVGQEKELTYKL